MASIKFAAATIHSRWAQNSTSRVSAFRRVVRPLPGRRPLDINKLSDDPAAALGDIIQAAADGDPLPSEGERLAGMVNVKAELTALREMEERLTALVDAASAGDRESHGAVTKLG